MLLFATRSGSTPPPASCPIAGVSPLEGNRACTLYSMERYRPRSCGFVAPRLQSLELETEGHAALLVPHEQSWLIALISEARAVIRLQWRSHDLDAVFLVIDDSARIEDPCLWIAASERRLGEFLLAVRILELENIYPSWTSYAYHGLVELALDIGHGTIFSISAPQLEDILKASPGPEKLRIGLGVDIAEDAKYHGVQLDSLRSLHVASRARRFQRRVLKTIHSGQMPLQLIIDTFGVTYFRLASLTLDTFSHFVARSNITLLCIKGTVFERPACHTNFDPLPLLRQLLRLEALVLESLRFSRPFGRCRMEEPILLGPISYTPSQIRSRIQLIHMTQCVLRWSDLRRTLETRPTKKSVVDGCDIFLHYSEENKLEAVLRSISSDYRAHV